jgi:hypothetical protein
MMPANAPGGSKLRGTLARVTKAKIFGLPAPLVIVGGVGVVYLLHKRSQGAAGGDAGDGGVFSGDAAAGGAGSGGFGGGGGDAGGGGYYIGGGPASVQRVVRRRIVHKNVRKVTVNAPNAKRVHVGPNRVVRRPLPRAGGGIRTGRAGRPPIRRK